MLSSLLGLGKVDPKMVEEITRKISRRLFAAMAPPAPDWYLRKSTSTIEKTMMAWPWYWADHVLELEDDK
jgi:hypothetical protein